MISSSRRIHHLLILKLTGILTWFINLTEQRAPSRRNCFRGKIQCPFASQCLGKDQLGPLGLGLLAETKRVHRFFLLTLPGKLTLDLSPKTIPSAWCKLYDKINEPRRDSSQFLRSYLRHPPPRRMVSGVCCTVCKLRSTSCMSSGDIYNTLSPS